MELATYRIATGPGTDAQTSMDGEAVAQLVEDGQESNLSYFTKVFIASAVVSIILKWDSLAVDWPFDPTWPVAVILTVLFITTPVKKRASQKSLH